jgi:uncharacterized protein (TIGR01777 family)
MRALVTGATGFIGQRLLERLERPVVLSRDPERAKNDLSRFRATAFAWDAMAGPPPEEAFEGVDAVIHLAGESIAGGRWTKARKQAIFDSRAIGTKHLVEGLRRLKTRPRVLVSGSAVGYYGSRGDELLTEASAPGTGDFLADVCIAWEKAAREAEPLGIRVVLSRTGVVLGKGGPLAKMLPPFRFGLGGPLGNGRQWMPWIHLDDMVELLLHMANTESILGPVNAVAPHPVTNRQLAKTIGKQLHRPAILPAPYFGLRLLLGEFAKILFDSQRCVPEVAERSGFQHKYPELAGALAAILG